MGSAKVRSGVVISAAFGAVRKSRFGARLYRMMMPETQFPIVFASFATFCSNSLRFLLFASRLVQSAWIARKSRPSHEVRATLFFRY